MQFHHLSALGELTAPGRSITDVPLNMKFGKPCSQLVIPVYCIRFFPKASATAYVKAAYDRLQHNIFVSSFESPVSRVFYKWNLCALFLIFLSSCDHLYIYMYYIIRIAPSTISTRRNTIKFANHTLRTSDSGYTFPRPVYRTTPHIEVILQHNLWVFNMASVEDGIW